METGDFKTGQENDDKSASNILENVPPFGTPLDDETVVTENGEQIVSDDTAETNGENNEVSKEDFEAAIAKYNSSWQRWNRAYFGEYGVVKDRMSYSAEVDKRLGYDGFIPVVKNSVNLLTLDYDSFKGSGLTLEDLTEFADEFDRVASDIEKIDMSDFVEPGTSETNDETNNENNEVSKEDFEAAKAKFISSFTRYSEAYFGEYNAESNTHSHSLSFRFELNKRLGYDGSDIARSTIISKLEDISYDEFKASGLTLEDFAKATEDFEKVVSDINAIDMSDFVEPGSDDDTDRIIDSMIEEAKDKAIKEFAEAYINFTGLCDNLGYRVPKSNSFEFDYSIIPPEIADDVRKVVDDRHDYYSRANEWKPSDIEALTNRIKALTARIIEICNNSNDTNNEDDKTHEQDEDLIKELSVASSELYQSIYVKFPGSDKDFSTARRYFVANAVLDKFNQVIFKVKKYNNGTLDSSEVPGLLEEIKNMTEIVKNINVENGDSDIKDNPDDSEDDKTKVENKEKAENIRILLDTRDTKRLELICAKVGLDDTASLNELSDKLNSMSPKEIARILDEVDKESSEIGERELTPEEKEAMRKLTFGQWLAINYDTPGKGKRWPEPNFFAAPRERQQEAIRRYMELFEADANLEVDRKVMIKELSLVENIKATLKEMGMDPSSAPEDLKDRLDALEPNTLNNVYQKVVKKKAGDDKGGRKPNPAEPTKPTDDDSLNPTEPTDDDSLNPAEPIDDSANPKNPIDTAGETSGEPVDYKKRAEDYTKRMPSVLEDVPALLESLPDVERLFGSYDKDELARDTFSEVVTWRKLNDDMKAYFLQYGTLPDGADFNVLKDLMSLQKKGILPRVV